MYVTSNQYDVTVFNMIKRQINSDLQIQLTNGIACCIINFIIILIL